MAREVVTGYCWPQSVGPGEQVGLHLSSSGGRPVRVEVARVGGHREVVFRADAVAADEHETPKDASVEGVRLAGRAHAGRRPDVAVGLLRGRHGDRRRREGAARLRVLRRAPGSGARIVLALATNTWHAYNDFGGPNLYTGGTQVAMQRPMAAGYLYKPPGKGRRVTGTGAPDPQNAAHVGYIQLNHLSGYAGSAGWPDWELPFIEWAEREGFEIGVCTNADLEEHPEVLDGASLYLSVGHDEYWSRGIRDTVEAFIARGGNAAFFSGNTSLWQVRIEGDDHDVMVGYKGFFKNDPLMGTDREPEVTTFWSDVVVGRPENHMTGVSFTRGGYHRIGRNVTTGLGGYTVHRAGHWIFDGTGLGYGDVLGAGATVVGYECDGCVFTYRDGLPYPTGEDGTPSTFEILGTCPTQHFTRETAPRPPKPGEPSELEYIASRVFGTREPEAMERIRHGHAVLGAYTNDAGATVVTSGSTDWAHGLAGRDPQIEQITRNVLTRLGSGLSRASRDLVRRRLPVVLHRQTPVREGGRVVRASGRGRLAQLRAQPGSAGRCARGPRSSGSPGSTGYRSSRPPRSTSASPISRAAEGLDYHLDAGSIGLVVRRASSLAPRARSAASRTQ